MKSLGKLLIRRFQYQGNLNDIEKAIDCYNKYLPFASGDEDKIECMTALKTANTMHKARLQSSNNLSNPERLRIIIEDLKTLCESNHQQSYKFIPQLRDLVDLHFIRFQLYDDITDLGEVITTLRKIVDLTELDESTTATVKAARQMVLLLASSYHFNLKKSQNTLGKGQDKVHGLNEHTRSGVCASDDLGTNSGVNITEFSEMDAIIKMCNASIKVIPDSSSAKPWFLSVIGRLYVERYGLTKDMRDFGIASSKLRSAVELASNGSRSKAITSGMLGGLYLNHFFNSNDFADLYRASSYLDDALKVTHDEQTFKPYFLNSFSIIKFQQSGMATADTVWIDGAIELFFEALALTPNNTAQKATYLLNLGTSIISRLRMVQGNKSIANAMSVFRHYFLTCIPDGHSEYTKLKYEFESIAESFDKVTVSMNPNLIDKLAKLYRSTSEVAKEVFQEGQVAQISERLANVLERVTRPETVTNISSNDRSTENLHLLGLVSLKRYKQRRNTLLMDWIDIDEAVTLLRAARTSSIDPPKRSRILADLGEALNERFGDLGEQGDLDEAISAQEEAIRLIKDNNEQRLKISSDLGCSLVRYYGYYGNAELLNKGISLQEEAVKFASDYSLEPRRHKYLHNLSVSLICRIRKVKDLGKESKLKDVERAIDLIRIAIRLVAADDTCVVEYKRDVQLCLLLKNQLTPKEVLDA